MATPIIVRPPQSLTAFEPYEELQGSPQARYEVGKGYRSTRRFKVAWGDRHAFAQALAGDISREGTNTVIYSPHEDPDFDRAIVTSVSVDPFDDRVRDDGGDTTRAAYTWAEVTAEYSTPEHDGSSGGGGGDGQPWVTESLEFAAEFLTLSHQSLYWDASSTQPLAETEAPQKKLNMCEWVYTIHQVMQVPPATVSLMGKVNAADVFSNTLGVTFPAETLLYNPPRLFREWTPQGARAFTLEYRFTAREHSWNKFFRKGVVEPQPIYAAGAVTRPYPTGDFSLLIG